MDASRLLAYFDVRSVCSMSPFRVSKKLEFSHQSYDFAYLKKAEVKLGQ